MEGFSWFNLIPFVKEYADAGYTHVITAIFVGIICVIAALLVSRSIKYTPDSEIPDAGFNIRNIIELISEMLFSLAADLMGERNARRFFPALAAVFLFIFFNNLIGLVPGFIPPTENINTTIGCGIFIFVYYNYVGFSEHGVSYLKHFFGPVLWLAPLVLPIELVSNAFRPVSLGLRLFGNMTGDGLVMSVFSDLVPVGIPVIFMAFKIFVAFFQATIFVILSTIYLTLALAKD